MALVEAARASTALAMASERRCAAERATLAALHIKLNDTTHCQLCPVGTGPWQQTRWHVLGQCQHPDLKDARRNAALELQAKTHMTFTQKIKDPRGRLPYRHHPEQAHRLRGPLEASRPDRPAGWANRIPDRAVLHWGAMRHFITLLGGKRPLHRSAGKCHGHGQTNPIASPKET